MNFRLLLLIPILFLFSCDGDDLPTSVNTTSNGFYILNEGNFSWTNSSLSFLDTDSSIIHNHIFEKVNNSPLGDVAQSMTIRDSIAYIVLNNSGKIYLMNINSNEFEGKITGFTSPRFIQILNDNKAYVSDLYSESISIINPSSQEITGSIDLGHSSEQMLLIGQKLYVTSWSFDRKLFVIDTSTDSVIDSLEVGLQPNSMVLDKDNKLWILCDGGFDGIIGGQEKASLYLIDHENVRVEETFRFENISDSPIELTINDSGDKLFFLNNDVYSMDIDSENLPELPFIQSSNKNLYALYATENRIYVTDARDYIQEGFIMRYMDNGRLVDSFQVGIVPGFFCMKN